MKLLMKTASRVSLFSILSLLFSFSINATEKNGGVGHGASPKIATADDIASVDFTHFNQDSFNDDNYPDRLICSNTRINGTVRINVRVIDGKTNKDIYKWNWSESSALKGDNSIRLTGCDIVYLRSKRPSIVVSTAYESPTIGYRIRAPQFLILNRPSDNKLQAKHIYIPGTSSFFTSAARSVKCTQVPKELKDNGVKNGAYCFFAGYDSELPFFTRLWNSDGLY